MMWVVYLIAIETQFQKFGIHIEKIQKKFKNFGTLENFGPGTVVALECYGP
jgi:hypothetical protein